MFRMLFFAQMQFMILQQQWDVGSHVNRVWILYASDCISTLKRFFDDIEIYKYDAKLSILMQFWKRRINVTQFSFMNIYWLLDCDREKARKLLSLTFQFSDAVFNSKLFACIWISRNNI